MCDYSLTIVTILFLFFHMCLLSCGLYFSHLFGQHYDFDEIDNILQSITCLLLIFMLTKWFYLARYF